MLAVVEKNMLGLQQNCSSVAEEVDEINRRLSKALKDRTEFLKGELSSKLQKFYNIFFEVLESSKNQIKLSQSKRSMVLF